MLDVHQPDASVDRAAPAAARPVAWRMIEAWAFLLPSMVILAIFTLYPLVDLVLLSTQRWDGLGPRAAVGLANYEVLITDTSFWASLRNNALFTFGGVLGTCGLGLGLALAIERRVPGWRYLKVIYFLPVMISMSVVSVLWANIYEPNLGLLNSLLRALGLADLARPWLGDPSTAMSAIIAVWIWQYSGLPMLYLLTAMEDIPVEVHDAATVDGATGWQRVRHIILPLIRPVLITVVTLQLIFSLKVFDLVFVMTRGGPGFATSVWAMLLYQMSFANNRFGYAAAIAVLMLLIIGLISLLYPRLLRMNAHE